MPTKSKKAGESYTIMTQMVLPNDTNALNNLRGGKILHWMDIATAIAAGKHANATVVTVSVDQVSFVNPIKLGDVVTITARATRSFRTSIETHVEVWAENLPTETKYKCNEAYYTFVALDSNGRPRAVPEVEPESEIEVELYKTALKRRQLRLIIAGRMDPAEADELRSLFESGQPIEG